MRTALGTAIRDQDRIAVSAIRSALAAIDNAEAVDESLAPPTESGLVAGGVHGLGRGDVPRRPITPQEEREIVLKVVAERREFAAQYDALQRHDDANRLRAEIAVLSRFLGN
jgi:uncharacterized protein YqeY